MTTRYLWLALAALAAARLAYVLLQPDLGPVEWVDYAPGGGL